MARIFRAPGFDRAFKKKSPDMQAAILHCLDRLAKGDQSRGLRAKKMRGHRDVWEARVDRANRVTFERRGEDLYLRANCNHDVLGSP